MNEPMTKREVVKAYRKMAKRMLHLHNAAANHISRRDNNVVFEMGWKCRAIADRIEREYEEPREETTR